MKRYLSLALMAVLALGVSSAVYANVCAFDPTPAASLLFPFVSYQYGGGTSGATTIFSITNVSSEAQIVHVTLWTDFSVAILDFNIVLSGYDTQQINIRDILANGDLPVTGTAGSLIVNGPVPVADGPVSPDNSAGGSSWYDTLDNLPDAQSTAVFDTTSPVDRCSPDNDSYPGKYADGIPASIVGLLQGWLQSSQVVDRVGYLCGPDVYGLLGTWFETRDTSTPTWMYITADVVYTCNQAFPESASYWTPAPDGEAMYQNVLIGDVAWVDAGNRFSEMDNAVSLEADQQIATVATPADDLRPTTFYHRYSRNNATFSDFREPLPTAWGFRYEGAMPGDGLTTYIRAFKAGTNVSFIQDLDFFDYYTYDVDESPDVFIYNHCLAYTYYAWDEDENVNTTTTQPYSVPGVGLIKPNLLPLETQEVSVEEFNYVDNFGWMMFIWPRSNAQVGFDQYQTWMGTKVVFNDYSAFHTGAVLANYNCFDTQILDILGINYDYVDFGGFTP